MWRWWGRGRSHEDKAEASRWVVVDVETSGLNATRDRLLAIAAVALRVDWPSKRIAIAPGDSFEVVLRQQQASERHNILLHGIGVQQQKEGMAPDEALRAFAEYAGESPLLAFHAAFDQTLLNRYVSAELSAVLTNRWLDIEHLCAVTNPGVRARSLDEWLAYFGITCAVRHQAAADTWAECELMLRIWPRVAPECESWRDVEKLARQHHWLGRA